MQKPSANSLDLRLCAETPLPKEKVAYKNTSKAKS